MKVTIWKAVFAAMNPSPLFESIAEFAELRADLQRIVVVKQLDKLNDIRVVGRRHTRKAF